MMRPAEFAQVVVALFLPALLLAWPIQFWFFRRGGLLRAVHAARVVAAALLMPLGALVLTAMVVLNAPPHWGRWLAVHELAIGGRAWPVFPLALASVALAGAFSTWWALRSARVRPVPSR